MYLLVLALLSISALFAADQRQLLMATNAQAAFERVEQAAAPQLEDAVACEQAQASLLAVATREEAPDIHFRKGYCELATAALTRDSGMFTYAASEFERAIATWPDRVPAPSRKKPVEPLPSGVRALAFISGLEAGKPPTDQSRNEMAIAIENNVCPAGTMAPPVCEAVLGTARQWLGWIALQRGDLYTAAERLRSFAGSPLERYVAAKQAYRDRNYPEAASRYLQAVDGWKRAISEPAPSLPDRSAAASANGSCAGGIGRCAVA